MSKQSEAKEKQGYVAKLILQTCMNCSHCKSDVVDTQNFFGDPYTEEKNIRCGLGGFSVKKMGSCNEWGGKGGVK